MCFLYYLIKPNTSNLDHLLRLKNVKSPAPAIKQEPGLITFNPYGLIIT
jgi:hypothetical protein